MDQVSFIPESRKKQDSSRTGGVAATIDPPRLLVQWSPFWPTFFDNISDGIFRRELTLVHPESAPGEFWPDVFVARPMPWSELASSAIFHAALVLFIVATGGLWLGGERVRLQDPLRHTPISYYKVDEYLPELKAPEPPAPARATSKGDPELARQRIISVPPDADNSVQTIVNPMFPQKLLQAEPMPNLVIAAPTVVKPKLEVPVDLPFILPRRINPQVEQQRQMAKLPELAETGAVAAPAQVSARSFTPLDLPQVEPVEAPKLALPEQFVARRLDVPNMEAVAAPSVVSPRQNSRNLDIPAVEAIAPPVHGANAAGPNKEALGQIVALNLRPAAPEPELKVPDGSRSGVFAATPEGRTGAAGTPEVKATSPADETTSTSPGHGADASAGGPAVAAIPGVSVTGGNPPKTNGSIVAAEPKPGPSMAMSRPFDRPRQPSYPPPAPGDAGRVQDDSVFGGRRVYAMHINLPNLTSAGGSWIIRFAERDEIPRPGDLSTPVALNKVDPAYPPDLIREKVEGVVTLFAIIKEDGTVSDIRVLHGVNERLNENARIALSRWHFRPATKNGVPVELEAVVQIPFRVRRTGF